MNSKFVALTVFLAVVVQLSSSPVESRPFGVSSFTKELETVLDHLGKRFAGKVSGFLECVACKAVVALAHTAFSLKQPENDIVTLITKGCEKLKIESTRVCTGIVKMFKAEVFTVVDDVLINPNQVCGRILGPSCAHYRDPSAFWNVTLPKTPKPKSKPVLPPKPGSHVSRVLHISDIHLDPLYIEGGNPDCKEPLCCRKNDPPPEPGHGAGPYGDYRSCDTPVKTLENMLEHINKTFADKLDYMIWTGDVPAHNDWNQSRNAQLQAINRVTKLIEFYLPNLKVFPAVGNHEGSPVNSYPPPFITGPNSNDWLRNALANHWRHWLPLYAKSTIQKGAFYSVLVSKGFRIVSLNMNYCNNMNWWLLIDNVDPAGQLKWLVDVLQEAEDNGEKVHILGHIPPGSSDCLKPWSWNYYDIINRYNNTVTAQFFGHTHNDEFELFFDQNNWKDPISVAYLGPSVTPYSNHNPGFRIYEMDGDYPGSSRVVLNHETYILDLVKANKGMVEWTLEYTPKELYQMKSLLPSDWLDFVKRMEKNNTLADEYYTNFYKSSHRFGPCSKTAGCVSYHCCRGLTGRSYDPGLCKRVLGLDLKVQHYNHFSKLLDIC